MTVGDLLDLLDGLDENMEVRFASQPSYPFEYGVDDGYIVETENGNEFIYLVEGEQIGYLPDEVRETIGWGR